MLRRVSLDRAQHFGIEDKLIDQRLALGELQRLDAQLELRVELVDRAIEAPPHQVANRRHDNALERRPDGQRADDQREPQRQRDGGIHRAVGWRGCT